MTAPSSNGKIDSPLSPSDMFAMAHGTPNTGPYRCHWCGSAAIPKWIHDGPTIRSPYQKTLAKCPAEPYICNGCWLWRRQSVTANYLTGGLRDRQSPQNNSWWITPTAVWAIREADYPTLLDILVKPPKNFTLMLRHDPKVPINIHTAVANNLAVVKRDTPLHFTYNQSVLQYSAYELEQASILGPAGLDPGVQAIVRMLGLPAREAVNEEEKAEAEKIRRKGGRPRETPIPHPNKDVVLASGDVLIATS